MSMGDSNGMSENHDRVEDSYSINRRTVLQLTGAFGAGSITSVADVSRAQSSDLLESITEIPKDSEYGFNYPYLLYVPQPTEFHKRPILVEPTNNPSATDDFSEVREYARKIAEYGTARFLSDELSVPLVVPMFPRPKSDPVDAKYQVQSLDRDSMLLSDGPLERPDLQLKAMVNHATEKLRKIDYPVKDSIILNGFSASGNFVNRFTALQPEIVDSVTAGAVNGTPVLPISEEESYTLDYHIGIADLEELTGKPFQREEWTGVDQLVYMGGDDENDTIPYPNLWSEKQRSIALAVYGHHMQEDRMPYSRRVYQESGATGDVLVYPNTGHSYTPKIHEALVKHHEKYTSGWYVSFEKQPLIGEDTVQVAATVPENAPGGSYEVVIESTTQGTLGVLSDTISPGTTVKSTIPLSAPPKSGEQLSASLIEQGGSLSNARANDTSAADGKLNIASVPVAGDESATIEYELASNYSPEATPKLRLETESGGATVIKKLSPGESGQISAEMEDVNGVPFAAGREIAATIVDADPAGARPVAKTQTTIENSEGLEVEVVSIDAPELVTPQSIANPIVEVRGLGGSGTGTLNIEFDDEVLSSEEIELSVGERKKIETSLRIGENVSGEHILSVHIGDEVKTKPLFIADLPEAGTGEIDDPFKISTAPELGYAGIDTDAHYELANDIDLSGISNFPRLGNWEENNSFTGSFDGKGNAIHNLNMERETKETFDGIGLFGSFESGRIENLRLKNIDIDGKDSKFVGGLIGIAWENGKISRVSVTGQVTGGYNVGGIIGGTQNSDEGTEIVISEVASETSVSGQSKIGGLVGQFGYHRIEKSYVLGSLQGQRKLGGLVGHYWEQASIQDSFAAPSINGNDRTGGLLGTFYGIEPKGCYWDKEATGEQTSPGGGTALATDQMQGNDAENTMTALDFDNTWKVVTDPPQYPLLRWQNEHRTRGPPAIPGFNNPPTDPDEDGLFEDVNGDGTSDVVDVQAMFENIDNSTLEENPQWFDFNEDGSVNIVDVQKLLWDL